jgi:hypothetical protein
MTRIELLGLKKAAIVLKALADGFEGSNKTETMMLVQMVVQAANELEAINASDRD